MIFCLRQVMEKTREHNTKGFTVFVDIKKAYDSVPREALYSILKKEGIPSSLITVVRSFHDQMSAVVKYEGNLGEEIQVRNGLRQGCVLAPISFNIYINCVMREWREKVKDTGIRFKYDMTKSLVGGYQKRTLSMGW